MEGYVIDSGPFLFGEDIQLCRLLAGGLLGSEVADVGQARKGHPGSISSSSELSMNDHGMAGVCGHEVVHAVLVDVDDDLVPALARIRVAVHDEGGFTIAGSSADSVARS